MYTEIFSEFPLVKIYVYTVRMQENVFIDSDASLY